MRKHQRGITAIGWLVLLVPLAIVVYAGIRLAPIYLNYMRVARCLDETANEVTNDSATKDAILKALDKHFVVDSVEYPTLKDIKITRDNGTWKLEADYDDQAPLFSNVAVLVTFDKAVKLKGGIE